jgi:hypothetical protein
MNHHSRRQAIGQMLLAAAAPLSSVRIASGQVAWNGKSPASQTPTPKVVCFFLDGGLSHLDSFDPKPDALVGIRGELHSIPTSVSGVHFSELWPKLALMADRMAVLRSLHHRHNEHGFARRCMHTLQQDSGRQTPSLGSVVQWQSRAHLPVHVCLPNIEDYSGALGTEFRAFPLLGPVGKQIARTAADPDEHGVDDRLALLSRLNTVQSGRAANARMQSLQRQQQKIRDILHSPVYRDMIDTTQVPDKVKQRFGDSEPGRLALLARNAVAAQMQFTVVNLPGWDMHTAIFDKMRAKAPAVDVAIAAFLEELEAIGEWDSTVVLVASEFGRSPAVESGGGRGHWPGAMSILAAGGPIPKGLVIGDTGLRGEQSESIAHRPEDLLASLYRWLKLDWELFLPGENARLNTTGTAISQLGIE